VRPFSRYRFRAKYFWSAFLVLGVLSITIGANRLDPLVVKALALQDRVSKLFDYGYIESANVIVRAQDGLRTLLIETDENAAGDPVKYYPRSSFDALVAAVNYTHTKPLTDKFRADQAAKAKIQAKADQAAAAEAKKHPKPKPSPEDPFKYVKLPLKTEKPSWMSGVNPFKPWASNAPSPSPTPTTAVLILPEQTPIVGLEWRASDPKNLIVIRTSTNGVTLASIGKTGRETISVDALYTKGEKATAHGATAKALADLLADMEKKIGMGKVGSFSASLATDPLSKLSHGGMKRVVPLDDVNYKAIYRDMLALKKEIDDTSDRVAAFPVGDSHQVSVLEASDIYLRTQAELYANYIRNAHAEDDATVDSRDKKIEKAASDRANDFTGFLKNGALMAVTPLAGLFTHDKHDVAEKEAEKIDRSHGAGTYTPHAMDALNLHLNTATALPFYMDPKLVNWTGQHLQKTYNVRHVLDPQGGYDKLELFINPEEKRLTEYAILADPKTKHGYLKLLQATAIRERMTNRWSLRRMMGLSLSDDADRKVMACGTDLVSYRLDRAEKVSEMENYSSLWQADRFNDYSLVIPKLIPRVFNNPLFDDETYAQIVLDFAINFDEGGAWLRGKPYNGNIRAFLDDVKLHEALSLKNAEEKTMTAGTVAHDIFTTYNLPADDLKFPAIATRSAWKAMDLRAKSVESTLVQMKQNFKWNSIPDAKAAVMAGDAVTRALKTREAAWRAKQAGLIQDTLAAVWNDFFVGDRNNARYEDFEKKLLPLAAIGARAVHIQRAVEDETRKLAGRMLNSGTTRSIWGAKDRRDPNYYISDDLARISYVTAMERDKNTIKDRVVPVTPDQLSRLFYKKLELLGDSDSPREEREAVERISANKAVVKYMGNFFAEVGGEYQKAVEAKFGKAPTDATTTRGVAGAPDCAAILQSGANGTKERVSKPAAEGNAPVAKDVDIDETNTPLGEVLVPSAQATMTKFLTAIATPPKVKPPEVAPSDGVIGKGGFQANRGISNFSGLDSLHASMPRLTADATRVARPRFIPKFLLGEEEENFYIPDPKAREAAKVLFQEALGMIGLAQAGGGGDPLSGFNHNVGYSSSAGDGMGVGTTTDSWDYWELRNYIAIEQVIRAQMPKSTLLERTAGTLLDQKILGNIIENEVYGKAPILAMQNSVVAVRDTEADGLWKRFVQGKVFVPSMLRSMTYLFTKERTQDGGWLKSEVRSVIYQHMYRAATNDLGKVEDFCEADLRDYKNDDKFKTMFKSIAGLRDAFASKGPAKAWDDEVAKDIRSWQQRVLEDYIDPLSMYIMIAILVVMAWQMAPVLLGFMASAGAATTFGGVAAATGELLGTFAKVLLLLSTGNLSPVTIMFSLQSFLMASVFCYQLPPQADYAFQVANSTVKVDKVQLANREKNLSSLEEVAQSRLWARFGVAMEFVQFGAFTAPGIYRTLGFKGSKMIAGLTEGVDATLAERVAQKSLRDLIHEKGVTEGVAEYSKTIGTALKNLDRASSVAKAATEGDIAEVMVQRTSKYLADKEILTAIYGKVGVFDEATQTWKDITSTGVLRETEEQIAKTREYIKTLQDEAAELKKSNRWIEARAYARNLKYKYGKDAKYFALIVAKDYEEAAMTGKVVMTGKNAKELQTLFEVAKLRDLEYKAAYLEQQANALFKLGAGEVTPEIAAQHLRRLSLSDWQMHEKLTLDAVGKPMTPGNPALAPLWKRVLHLATRMGKPTDKVSYKFFKEIYKGFDYVAQDYKALNPRMVSIAHGIKNGAADLTIDKAGEANKLNPQDIIDHPENYEYLTIKLDDL
jgi:hypothetical protein